MPALGSLEDQLRKQRIMGETRKWRPVQDLAQYLSGEFQQGEPIQITVRRSDAVGRQLSDRVVSRLEVLSAIRRLPHRQRRIMELLHVENLPCHEVVARLNISERTLYRDRAAALDAMASIIYEWA